MRIDRAFWLPWIAAASFFVTFSSALACSSPDPTIRRMLTCGLLYISSVDALQGNFLPEWNATFAVLRAFEEVYDRAEEASIASLEAQILAQLLPLGETGNPIAQLVSGLFLLSPNEPAGQNDGRRRRAADLILSAAAAGSNSALVIAVGMFRTPPPRPYVSDNPRLGDLLPADAALCWNAIDDSEPPKGSPRVVELSWVASKIRPQAMPCITASLEALRK